MRTGHSRVVEDGAQRERRWLWRAMPLLASVLASAGSASAGPAPLSRTSLADQQLSSREIDALRAGADLHPYATLTLLHVLRNTSAVEHDGSLYLESVPEATLTSLLLGSADSSAVSALLGELQWNPYSASTFLVQVTWSVRPMASGARAIRFHTRLLSSAGGLQHPPLEPDTTVLLTKGDVRFLGAAAFM